MAEALHEERVRMMKTVMRGVAILLGLAVAGCGGAEKPSATKEGEKAKTASEAPQKSDGPKGPYIGAFRIGHGFASNGSVAVEGATFAQSEPVFLSFDVMNSPSDGKVRLLIHAAAEEKTLYQEDVPISADKSPNVSFKIEMKSWPVGDYVLRILLNAVSTKVENANLGQATLKIVKERPK